MNKQLQLRTLLLEALNNRTSGGCVGPLLRGCLRVHGLCDWVKIHVQGRGSQASIMIDTRGKAHTILFFLM